MHTCHIPHLNYHISICPNALDKKTIRYSFAPSPPAPEGTATWLKEHSTNAAQRRSSTARTTPGKHGAVVCDGSREGGKGTVGITRTVSVTEKALTGHE